MISQEIKDKIFNQINKFRETQLRDKKIDVYKDRYHVDPLIATDRAKFFKYIHVEQMKKDLIYNKIIDLTFGSGNLTFHILLDNNVEFSKLILNDKNIDDANFAEELGEVADEITDDDILQPDALNYKDKFDLIIFNPQIGGKDKTTDGIKTDGYKAGSLMDSTSFQVQMGFHLMNEDILTALSGFTNLSDCIVCVDDEKHSIIIHSWILSKTEMKDRFDKLKIFNYYDVFYKSKNHKKEGQISDIVKFRINFEKLTNDTTVISFMGDNKEFDAFFHDFNLRYVYQASDKGKQFVVGFKNETDNILCFQKENNEFIKVDCQQKYEAENIDLEDTLAKIHSYLQELKSLDGGELFVLEDKSGINTEIAVPETKKDKQKPFKNFLLEFINKETR